MLEGGSERGGSNESGDHRDDREINKHTFSDVVGDACLHVFVDSLTGGSATVAEAFLITRDVKKAVDGVRTIDSGLDDPSKTNFAKFWSDQSASQATRRHMTFEELDRLAHEGAQKSQISNLDLHEGRPVGEHERCGIVGGAPDKHANHGDRPAKPVTGDWSSLVESIDRDLPRKESEG